MRNNVALKTLGAVAPVTSPRVVAPPWSRSLGQPPERAPSPPLTDRQLECLRWISMGKSSTDIGVILRISGRTVDYHVIAICERLGVRTRMQAVALAIQRGWLSAA